GEAFSLDERLFHRRWLGICTKLKARGKVLAKAIRSGRLNSGESLQALLSGKAETLGAQAEALGLDAELTGTILRLTLLPVLAHVAKTLEPLRQQVRWE